MISTSTIDQLTVAIAIDRQLRGDFLKNRLEAIDGYNRGYARRFGESPIMLNEEERRLVTSVPASSIQQFYEAMAVVVERLEAMPFYHDQYILGEQLPDRTFAGSRWPELYPRSEQVSAA
jgi:hypothetical protein